MCLFCGGQLDFGLLLQCLMAKEMHVVLHCLGPSFYVLCGI